MRIICVAASVLLASAGPCLAAGDLGIAMDSIGKAMKDAEARSGAEIDFSSFECPSAETNCRWESGTGVDLLATRIQGTMAYQLEAGWNNGRSTSNSQSGVLFRGLCATIVAAVEPEWKSAQIASVVNKIALTKPTAKNVETEKKVGKLNFYGSRNIPDQRDFPTEAFVQCGVTANLAE